MSEGGFQQINSGKEGFINSCLYSEKGQRIVS